MSALLIGLTLLVVILIAAYFYNRQRNPQEEMEDALLHDDGDYGTDNVFELVDEIEAHSHDPDESATELGATEQRR